MKLEIGYKHSFEIRRETFVVNTPDNFSILYLSDLHLNKFSKSIITSLIAKIEFLNPTILLLGGDYVDSKKGLIHFANLLRSISLRENTFAIAGNHDIYFGIDEIEKIITEHNVVWLEGKSFTLNLPNSKLKIDGNIITKAENDYDLSILVLHKPIDINLIQNVYNIALAGHLHGCQFVLWESEDKLFPGKFFYRWNILKAALTKGNYYISKGLGDTLPIRYNCKRDLLFIQVINNNT